MHQQRDFRHDATMAFDDHTWFSKTRRSLPEQMSWITHPLHQKVMQGICSSKGAQGDTSLALAECRGESTMELISKTRKRSMTLVKLIKKRRGFRHLRVQTPCFRS